MVLVLRKLAELMAEVAAMTDDIPPRPDNQAGQPLNALLSLARQSPNRGGFGYSA